MIYLDEVYCEAFLTASIWGTQLAGDSVLPGRYNHADFSSPGATAVSDQDRIFIKNFTLLIVGLAVFTVVIILAAIQLNKLTSRPNNPDKLAALESRISPVGSAYAGETGAAALAAAQAAAAADVPELAFDGSTDGALIYNNVCSACHTSGVAGSPKLEQAAWQPRLAQGMDTVIQHAIEGYQGSAGLMPARGGRPDLSDEQVSVTVQWMVDQLQ